MRLAVCLAALPVLSLGCGQILGLDEYAAQHAAVGGAAGSASSSTSTSTTGVGGSGGAAPEVCAGVSMLGDNLDGVLDSRWTEVTDTGALWQESGGQVTATSQFDSTGNAYRYSESFHDLRGEGLSIEVIAITQDVNTKTSFQVGDRDANNWVGIVATANKIEFEQLVGGFQTILATAMYAPATDRFWGIREKNGEIILETAPSAASGWITRASVAVGQLFPFDYVHARYGLEKPNTTGVNQTATFANVNNGLVTAEPWCKAGTLTDSFAAASTPTRVWRKSEQYGDCIITETMGNVVFGVSATHCNYGSSSRYDLTGGSFHIHLTSMLLPTDAIAYMEIESERNTGAIIQLQDNVLAARTAVNGSQTQYFNLDNTAKPTWWRIKDAGAGEVEVATSIDGTIWNPEQTFDPGIPIDSVRRRFGIYGGATPGSASFGSLNAAP